MAGQWRHVWGFSGYIIDSLGTVKSKDTGKIVPTSQGLGGCTTVILTSNSGVQIVKKVCRLVIDSFDWASEGYTPVIHIDDNKANNRLSNLRRILDTQPKEVTAVVLKPPIAEVKKKERKKAVAPNYRGRYDKRPIRIVQTGQEFKTKKDACLALGLDFSTVSKMLKGVGRNKTHHGLTFEYVGDDQRDYVRVVETGKIYRSVRDLCVDNNLDPHNVRNMLRNRGSQKFYRGLSFESVPYTDARVQGLKPEEIQGTLKDLQLDQKRKAKPVRVIETGEVYPSQSATARAIGAYQSDVRRVLLGMKKSHNGLTFEFIDKEEYERAMAANPELQ